mgnify:CR=1 FL=1
MKFFFIIITLLFLSSCGKPKYIIISGDNECKNKTEEEQFLKENLKIEIKKKKKKVKSEVDLVELNLKEDQKGNRKVTLTAKNKTDENIKILSNKEISKIKKDIKNKKKKKNIAKKLITPKDKIKKIKKIKKNINNVNKKNKDIVDICAILDKCNIDEISKYLIKQGKKKKFPDITTRQ